MGLHPKILQKIKNGVGKIRGRNKKRNTVREPKEETGKEEVGVEEGGQERRGMELGAAWRSRFGPQTRRPLRGSPVQPLPVEVEEGTGIRRLHARAAV